MQGEYNIVVKNKRVSYRITVNRYITIIRGFSGTGKSTFINMLETALNGTVTGISLETNHDPKKIEVIRNEKQLQYIINSGERDRIFIVDGNLNLSKDECFIEFMKTSDSYEYNLIKAESVFYYSGVKCI